MHQATLKIGNRNLPLLRSIDVLVEGKLKENMSKGVFKKGLSSFIQKQFNRHGNKNYHKDQLRQKFQMLKVRHRVFSELIGRSGMFWDSHTKKVIGSEEA